MRTSSTHTKRLPWTVVDPPSEIFRNCTGLSEGDRFDLGETVLSVAELAAFFTQPGSKAGPSRQGQCFPLYPRKST
jgi:hypothetical protein